ncbi:hypothetical protein O1611_g3831 [Lasiodiplodia mahajangana]|uniref:Uncharacterized protein n=1 Tax=Lasiodiplodia mahajangana TaxID=1108764 RepID=A0ACC2JQN5_9PEZI|nr:hypothetical protein O1611_g3831 [Lasiodiplodia mahajangana]
MGHQESSPPRQRQRVPHHRHHHRHRHGHNHYAAALTANSESALTLGRLNREFHAPDSHVVVESWLGQVTAPVPTTRMRSPESRNQPVHHDKRPRSKDRQSPSWRQHARRVDPLWRPQHIPPARGSSPPRLLLPTRNPKRYKRGSDDSSLISDLGPLRGPRKQSYIQSTLEQAEGSRHKPLDEVEVGTSASSPVSHVGAVPAFEKQPRHKTRADKYETKKSGDRKTRGEMRDRGEEPPRKSKSRKRKPIATGKNVMNNFTSEAVLNDRITPNLKPGLFNNKRVSKNHPITDLSFSEMPFPTNQERDTHKQKALSSSRLREVQRENRELEQISSFFLPTCADVASRKARPAKLRVKEGPICKSMTSRDDVVSLATPSSPTTITKSCSIPTIAPSERDCRSGSKRETTYFTWSTSQHSPKTGKSQPSTQPECIERERSMTPESVRKALIATGVYKNTGIRLYDNPNDQQKHGLKETRGNSLSACSSMADQVDAYEGKVSIVNQESGTKSKSLNDTIGTVTSLAELERRWNTILPPEWRLHEPHKAEASPMYEKQQRSNLDIPISAGFPSRHEIAREALINPIRESPQNQHAHRHGYGDPNTNLHSTAGSYVPIPPKPDQVVDQVRHQSQDRDITDARDAMPPPPLPRRFNFPQVNNYTLGYDLSSSTRREATGSLEIHAGVSDCRHPRATDTCEGVSQSHEVNITQEKLIPTLDSASWIPQAITSSIASNEREKTLSRLSMRSPIYDISGKEKDTQGALRLTPPPTALVGESMADFIARIESELDEPTSLDEYCQAESMTEHQESHIDPVTSTYETHGGRSIASDRSRVDCRQLPHEITDTRFREAFETRHGVGEYEELAASTPMPTEISRGTVDELIEMSKFWRPNPFSYT